MASRETVERRRANRKAAREAKRISKKLRSVTVDGQTLKPAMDKVQGKKEVDLEVERHNASWERFRARRGSHPKYAHLASHQRFWEAWVAMVDLRDPARKAWWFSESASDDDRQALCRQGREMRASGRRFKLAKLTMRQRYDAVQKGRKFDLN